MSKTALLIVDHGSKRAEANETLVQLTEMIRALRPGLTVHYAHMQFAPPTVADGIEACVADGADEIVIHPYLLTPGTHATRDIPALATNALAKHPGVRIRVTEALGLDGKIAEVVLARAGL